MAVLEHTVPSADRGGLMSPQLAIWVGLGVSLWLLEALGLGGGRSHMGSAQPWSSRCFSYGLKPQELCVCFTTTQLLLAASDGGLG